MKTMKYIIAFCLYVNVYFAQVQYTGQSIEEILKLPDKEINLGIATLVLAKEFYPNINIDYFLQIIDYMAERFNYYFGHYKDADDRIAALNTYLYKKGYWNDNIIFIYDDRDLQVTKLENKFINGYLATKKGSCITMPMLYVILGERLHYPIRPVRSAKHFFVRYEPEEIRIDFKQNIESTNGGGYISDKQYQEDVFIPDKAIRNGVYLRTLSKKEYLASLLLINANEYLKNGKIKKAKRYYKLAIKYDPTFSSAYMNYGMTVLGEAKLLEEKMWNEKQEAIKQLSSVYVPKKLITNNYKPKTDKIFESKSKKLINGLVYNPISKKNNKNAQLPAKYEQQINIEERLKAIEEKYKPEILTKIAEYKKYTGKAKELGIVLEFPLQFFRKQAESIKQFRENGGY